MEGKPVNKGRAPSLVAVLGGGGATHFWTILTKPSEVGLSALPRWTSFCFCYLLL